MRNVKRGEEVSISILRRTGHASVYKHVMNGYGEENMVTVYGKHDRPLTYRTVSSKSLVDG